VQRSSRKFAPVTVACIALAVAASGGVTSAGAAGSVTVQAVTDSSALAVIGTIQVGSEPFGLAVSRDDTLYVANRTGDSVSVVPARSLTVGATVPVGNSPQDIAVDTDDDTVYIAEANATKSVSVMDGRSLTVVDTIGLPLDPSGVAVNSRDDTLYVTGGVQPVQGVLRFIRARNADDSTSRNVGQTPEGVAVDSGDDTVFVANTASSTVSVINGRTQVVATTINLPSSSQPSRLAVNSRDDTVYVGNRAGASISMIDGATGALVETQSLGGSAQPRVIALSPSDDTLYVPSTGGGLFGPWKFYVMNARNLDDSYSLNVGMDSFGAAVRSDGTVYVSLVAGFGTTNKVLALAQVTPTLTSTAGTAGSTGTITMSVQGGYAADDTTVTSVAFGATTATGWTRTGVNTWSGPVPAGTGSQPVAVTFNGGRQALAGNFVYSTDPAPTVTAISPASGTSAGGTLVTITGTNFISGATATIGGIACTGPDVVNSTTLTCTTGAHAAGTVNVVVTNPDTQTGTGTSLFTYLDPAPTVSGVAPASGPIAGGTAITINGSGFLPGASITTGGVTCDDTVLVSSTQLTCTTGPGAAGSVSVVVTNPGSLPGALPNGFTYVGPNPPPPPPSNPPSAPLDVTAVPGNGQTTISWRPPTDPGSFPVTSYRVTASPGGQSCLVSAPTLTCTLTRLMNGTPYTFTVEALNGAGWSPASAASAPVTPKPGPSPAASITLNQGTRTADGTHDRIRTSGDTRGITTGTLLIPWIRYAGQPGFKQGVASISVQSDGTFTWTRLIKKSKGLSAYVSWTDIRSNKIYWAKVR
jgi:YVTN family beta-propeller protein